MDKWKGSVAVVTGANSGIGLAILKKLATSRLKVVGFDTQIDAIERLKVELKNAKIYSWICDVTLDDITEASFKWAEKNVGPVDILVNCAGQRDSIGIGTLQRQSMTEIVSHIDVNYTAVVRCTRLAFKSMAARDAHGYVVNVNCERDGMSLAVKATANAMRGELGRLKNRKVRITNLSPGVGERAASEEIDNSSFDNPDIKPEHIGDVVVYLLTTPHEVCVSDMCLGATGCGV
jgi:NADP-dependent 3-hydroxy acid dehydrogenase YdfG